MREWINKENPKITAHKTYEWIDRVIILDESEGRRVLKDFTYTEFCSELDQWSEQIKAVMTPIYKISNMAG